MLKKEIDFKSLIIYGPPGEGKTIFCNMLISGYNRIYSNVDFFVNGKKRNMRLNNLDNLKSLTYKEEPGIVIIDEGGINLNSRSFMSKENRDFWDILFLWRKINCYFVWISQRYTSLDINQRELASLVIRMYKIRRKNSRPLFVATREKLINNKLIFDTEWKLDIIWWMKKEGRTYNTLESSRMV